MSGLLWLLWLQLMFFLVAVSFLSSRLHMASQKAINTEQRLNALVTAGPYVPTAGGTITGGLTVDGTLNSGAGNNVTAAASWVNANYLDISLGLNVPYPPPTKGTDGFGGGVWTASQATALTTLQGVINNTISALQNAHIFT